MCGGRSRTHYMRLQLLLTGRVNPYMGRLIPSYLYSLRPTFTARTPREEHDQFFQAVLIVVVSPEIFGGNDR